MWVVCLTASTTDMARGSDGATFCPALSALTPAVDGNTYLIELNDKIAVRERVNQDINHPFLRLVALPEFFCLSSSRITYLSI